MMSDPVPGGAATSTCLSSFTLQSTTGLTSPGNDTHVIFYNLGTPTGIASKSARGGNFGHAGPPQLESSYLWDGLSLSSLRAFLGLVHDETAAVPESHVAGVRLHQTALRLSKTATRKGWIWMLKALLLPLPTAASRLRSLSTAKGESIGSRLGASHRCRRMPHADHANAKTGLLGRCLLGCLTLQSEKLRAVRVPSRFRACACAFGGSAWPEVPTCSSKVEAGRQISRACQHYHSLPPCLLMH